MKWKRLFASGDNAVNFSCHQKWVGSRHNEAIIIIINGSHVFSLFVFPQGKEGYSQSLQTEQGVLPTPPLRVKQEYKTIKTLECQWLEIFVCLFITMSPTCNSQWSLLDESIPNKFTIMCTSWIIHENLSVNRARCKSSITADGIHILFCDWWKRLVMSGFTKYIYINCCFWFVLLLSSQLQWWDSNARMRRRLLCLRWENKL